MKDKELRLSVSLNLETNCVELYLACVDSLSVSRNVEYGDAPHELRPRDAYMLSI